MKFYNLVSDDEVLKDLILQELNKQLSDFSNQKESDEYLDIKKLIELVDKFNFVPVENVLKSDKTAFCWLNNHNGNIYINAKNKKGYKYYIKNNYLGRI